MQEKRIHTSECGKQLERCAFTLGEGNFEELRASRQRCKFSAREYDRYNSEQFCQNPLDAFGIESFTSGITALPDSTKPRFPPNDAVSFSGAQVRNCSVVLPRMDRQELLFSEFYWT